MSRTTEHAVVCTWKKSGTKGYRGTKVSHHTSRQSVLVLTRLKLRRRDSEPSTARPKSDIIDPLPVTFLPDRGPLNRLFYWDSQHLLGVATA